MRKKNIYCTLLLATTLTGIAFSSSTSDYPSNLEQSQRSAVTKSQQQTVNSHNLQNFDRQAIRDKNTSSNKYREFNPSCNVVPQACN